MAKLKLTARTVETTGPGKHSDAGCIGLYLHVSETGSAKWIFRFRWRGPHREMGLGAARGQDAVSLATARSLAMAARIKARSGIDPISARTELQAIPTFKEYAEKVRLNLSVGFKNEKHKDQWKSTLETHAASLHALPVDKITTSDVLAVLQPIWASKTETAGRLRGRIETILDAAGAEGLRSRDHNPARWRGNLKNLLSNPRKRKRKHHPAMAYADIPAFMPQLRKMEGDAPQALELTILCAVRTSEMIAAKIDEFDMQSDVWTIPGIRMKAGLPHRVPLSDRAAGMIQERLKYHDGSGYLFPAEKKPRKRKPGKKPPPHMSNMAMTMVLRRMKITNASVHGMRSTFRDWAGDETLFPRDIAEQALAHKIQDETEAAYRRSDALAKRRALMQTWSDYCSGVAVEADNVIQMKQLGGGSN